MNTKKLSKVLDSRKSPAPTGNRVGDEAKEKLLQFFQKGTSSNPLRTPRVADAAEVKTLKLQVSQLRKKVADAEQKAQDYSDLVAVYRRDKDEALAQITALTEQVNAARSVKTPFTLIFNSKEGTMKLGQSSAEDVTADDFKKFIDSICLVFPDMKVSVTVDNLSGTASEVKKKVDEDAASEAPQLVLNDSVEVKTPEEWTAEGLKEITGASQALCSEPTEDKIQNLKRIADKYNDKLLSCIVDSLCEHADSEDKETYRETLDTYLKGISTANGITQEPVKDSTVEEVGKALNKYLDEWYADDLYNLTEDGIPENLLAIIKELKKDGYLSPSTYDTYAEGAKKELSEAGVKVPSFALLSDSMVSTSAQFKELLKTKGIKDSVSIPGTPSKYRVSDSKNLHGFSNDAQVLEVQGKFVIYE